MGFKDFVHDENEFKYDDDVIGDVFIYETIKKCPNKNIFAQWNIEKCGYRYPFESIESFNAFVENIVLTESGLLSEATYELGLDIDYLMDTYLYPAIKDFYLNIRKYIKQFIDDGMIIFSKLSSKELPSDLAKLANANKEVDIGIGIFETQGYFSEKNAILINIFNLKYLIYLSRYSNVVDDEKLAEDIKSKINIHDIKDTISHELTHWFDDSIRNNTVSNYLNKLKTKKLTPEKETTISLVSNMEINAYIHGLKQFKKSIGEDEYNNLTVPELFNRSILGRVWKLVNQENNDFKQKWLRKFVSRMARENMIGNNMNFSDL